MKNADKVIRNLEQSKAMLQLLFHDKQYSYLNEVRLIEVLDNISSRLENIFNLINKVDFTDEESRGLVDVDKINIEVWQARGLMTALTGNDVVTDIDKDVVRICLENVFDRVENSLLIIGNHRILNIEKPNTENTVSIN